MRRRFVSGAGADGFLPKQLAQSGDICVSNGADIWFISLAAWQSYTGTEYQAIGVVVATSGDCGDDLVRVCSIPYMNCNTPDTGSMAMQFMSWNGLNITIGGGITETADTNTAKVDYNGKVNTTAILAKATAQSNWRTDATIFNADYTSTNNIFPAACCCWRFHTLGTNQGDWYLPACGEIYKGFQNKTAVESSLQALGVTDAYSSIYGYWSSTSYSYTTSWRVIWYYEGCVGRERYGMLAVRAFIQF